MAAKFKSRMREKARERASARRNQMSGGTTLQMPDDMKVEFFKVTKTTHLLDVIPYPVSDKNHPDGAKPGELWHSRRYFIHRNIGAEENSYVCPAKTMGDPCPICEYAKQRKNEGAEQKELDDLRPKERQLFNVIDLDEDPNKVMLWDMSYFLFGKQLDKELIEGDEEYGGFCELEDGYTLKIRFEKKSFNKTEFFECDRIDFKKRKEDYDEDIVEDAVPLDDVLKVLSYKELEKIFIMGASDREEQEEEEEEEAPKRRRRAEPEEEEEEQTPKRTRRSKKEEDEEPEEEAPKRKRRRAEPEPEEDEDEEPKATTRRRKRAPDPDEEEEEQEETPKRGRGRSKLEPEEEEDEEPEEKTPKRGRGSKEEDSGSKCSYGHKFGKDIDNFDDCDSCKKWAACNAAKRGK